MNLLGVRLHPSTESINAFGATVNIPDGWTVQSVQSAYETIHYWVEEPQLRDGDLQFSAIYPGGVSALSGDVALPLFYVQLDTHDTAMQESDFSFSNVTIYQDSPGAPPATSAFFEFTFEETEHAHEDHEDPLFLDYSFEDRLLFVNVADNSNEAVLIEVRDGGLFAGEWKPLEEVSHFVEGQKVALRLTDSSGNQTRVTLNGAPDSVWIAISVGIVLVTVALSLIARRSRHR